MVNETLEDKLADLLCAVTAADELEAACASQEFKDLCAERDCEDLATQADKLSREITEHLQTAESVETMEDLLANLKFATETVGKLADLLKKLPKGDPTAEIKAALREVRQELKDLEA